VSATTAGTVSYEKAPTQVLGRRFVALIIDDIIVSALLSGVFFLLADKDGTTYSLGGGAIVTLSAVGVVWTIGYWWVQEAAWGATIGKALVGIRVYDNEGGDAGVGQTLVRNLVRPFHLYALVGWIVAMASGPRRQRTFDMLAGTVVARRDEMAGLPPQT